METDLLQGVLGLIFLVGLAALTALLTIFMACSPFPEWLGPVRIIGPYDQTDERD